MGIYSSGDTCVICGRYDLYAISEDGYPIMLEPNSTVKVHTGIVVEIPLQFFGAIFARSGLATKKGIRPANCVGVIDSDYRGEVIVALHNDTDEYVNINDGERVAQLVLIPFLEAVFMEVNELSSTERGDSGFGSTGETEIIPGQMSIYDYERK